MKRSFFPELLFACLLLFLFRSPLLKLQPYYGIDLFDHVPAKLWMAHELKSGSLPLWNPYYSCGTPMAADDFTWGIYYPGMWFHLLWPGFGFTLEALAHLILSFYFFRKLAVYLGATDQGTLVGAITFHLGAPVLSLFYAGHANILYAACWLAPVFYYTAIYAREGKKLPQLSVVMGLQILGGHPEIVFFSTLFSLAFAMVQRRELTKRWLLAPFVLAVGLAAIHLAPVLEVIVSDSMRSQYWTYHSASDQSFPLSFSFTFLTPFLFGQQMNGTYWGPPFDYLFSKYIGLVPSMLLVFAVLRWKEEQGEVKFFLVATALSLFAGFGRESGYSQIADFVPILRSFSVPVNVMVFTAFFAALVVSFQWPRIFHRPNLYIIAAFFLISAAGYAFVYFRLFSFPESLSNVPLQIQKDVALRATVTTWLLLGLLLVFLFRRKQPGMILAFHIFCLLFFCSRWIQSTELQTYTSPDKWKILKLDPDFYRVFEDASIPMVDRPLLNQDLKDGVTDAIQYGVFRLQGGSTTLALKRYHEFKSFVNSGRFPVPDRHFHLTQVDSPLLKYANVKYLLSLRPVNDPNWLFAGQTSFYHYKIKNFNPRARLYFEYAVVSNPTELLRRMSEQNGLYFEHPPLVSITPSAESKGEAKIMNYSPNEIQIRTDSEKPAYLFLSEMYFSGWRCSVDNHPCAIERANYTFRAIAVSSGAHTVIVRYRPNSWVAGVIISIVSVIALLVLLVLTFLNQRAPDK